MGSKDYLKEENSHLSRTEEMSRHLPGGSKGRNLEVEITDTKQQGQTKMVSACSGGPDTSQDPGPSTTGWRAADAAGKMG